MMAARTRTRTHHRTGARAQAEPNRRRRVESLAIRSPNGAWSRGLLGAPEGALYSDLWRNLLSHQTLIGFTPPRSVERERSAQANCTPACPTNNRPAANRSALEPSLPNGCTKGQPLLALAKLPWELLLAVPAHRREKHIPLEHSAASPHWFRLRHNQFPWQSCARRPRLRRPNTHPSAD